MHSPFFRIFLLFCSFSISISISFFLDMVTLCGPLYVYDPFFLPSYSDTFSLFFLFKILYMFVVWVFFSFKTEFLCVALAVPELAL